jgi:hypothetical protein
MTLRTTARRLLLAAVVCALASSVLVVGARTLAASEADPDPDAAAAAITSGRVVFAAPDDVTLAHRPTAVRRDLALALTLTVAALCALAVTARRAIVPGPPPLATGDVRLPSRRGPPLALPR